MSLQEIYFLKGGRDGENEISVLRGGGGAATRVDLVVGFKLMLPTI